MLSRNKEYRFGFGGQERDNEIYGFGNSYTAEYWQYDSRLGRRWNVDPVVKHNESSYATFANNPIWFIDPDGRDTLLVNRGKISNTRLLDEKNNFDILINVNKKEFKNSKIDYNKDGNLRSRHNSLRTTEDAFIHKVWFKSDEEKSSQAIRMSIDFNYNGYKDAANVFKFLASTSSNFDYEFSYFGIWTNNGPIIKITTNYDKYGDKFGSFQVANHLKAPNAELIFHIHSHPLQEDGHPDVKEPSGLHNIHDNGGNNDINFKKRYGRIHSIFKIFAENEFYNY